MKTLKLICFCLLFSGIISSGYAQTAEISYTAIINNSLKGTPQEERHLDDLYAKAYLYIQGDMSLYRQSLPDSVLYSRKGGGEEGIYRTKLPIAKSDTVGALYLKEFASSSLLSKVQSFDKASFSEVKEPLENIDWKLTTERRTIGEFECTKATCSAFGRNWEAWFSPSIPISDGPWKLYGLPGLIIEAEDSEGKFKFHLQEVLSPISGDGSTKLTHYRTQLKEKKFLTKSEFANAEKKKKDDRKRAKMARMAAAAGEKALDTEINITFAETIERY